MHKLKEILILIFISPIAIIRPVKDKGVMLLHRPLDVSSVCALSEHLRYDVSFGMGLSDTITLVFRNLMEIDYECIVEIVTEHKHNVFLLIVIRFPTTLAFNCHYNPNCFTVLKKTSCINLCEEAASSSAVFSHYFMVSVAGRMRFRFVSNSSINADMNANQYEVTATAARRLMTGKECNLINETLCVLRHEKYCFTSGAECDGIKNCGIADWFDERKSACDMDVERLGYMPVLAVSAAFLCAGLAMCHFLIKCLPPKTYSFFIFNANEDNRLCIKPLFRAPHIDGLEIEAVRRTSIIPGSSSSSVSDELIEDTLVILERSVGDLVSNTTGREVRLSKQTAEELQLADASRKMVSVKSMTAKLHERLKSVTGRTKSPLYIPNQQRVTSAADVRDVRDVRKARDARLTY